VCIGCFNPVSVFLQGRLGELAFVASKSEKDNLTPSEVQENLKLPAGTAASACAAARNAFTRASVAFDFYDNQPVEYYPANRPLPPATEGVEGELGFELPVFTVSARDALKLEGVVTGDAPPVLATPQETQIPALRAYIGLASAAHHARLGRGLPPGSRTVGQMLLLALEEQLSGAPPAAAAAASTSSNPPPAAHRSAPEPIAPTKMHSQAENLARAALPAMRGVPAEAVVPTARATVAGASTSLQIAGGPAAAVAPTAPATVVGASAACAAVGDQIPSMRAAAPASTSSAGSGASTSGASSSVASSSRTAAPSMASIWAALPANDSRFGKAPATQAPSGPVPARKKARVSAPPPPSFVDVIDLCDSD